MTCPKLNLFSFFLFVAVFEIFPKSLHTGSCRQLPLRTLIRWVSFCSPRHHWHWHKVEYLVDEAYIGEEQQGDLLAMTPTIVDMLGVFFLKVSSWSFSRVWMICPVQASSYEFMAESSRQGSIAYWWARFPFSSNFHGRYSMEYAAQNKSVFHTLFMGAAKKAGIVDPGVSWRCCQCRCCCRWWSQACHGDELMYLFNVHLPLVLCE